MPMRSIDSLRLREYWPHTMRLKLGQMRCESIVSDSGTFGCIHVMLDLVGMARLGPAIHGVDSLDYPNPVGLPEKFAAAVKSYWPAVRAHTLIPSHCGFGSKSHSFRESFEDSRLFPFSV